jgi:hypothetical protein
MTFREVEELYQVRFSRSSACQPTSYQEVLLDAILLSGDQAVEAWRSWQRHGDIDHLDPASFQIMPLLYWSLAQQGVDDPLMGKLKGTYRMAWSRNQWLTSRVLPALQALHEQSVPMMLLKGAALNALYGEEHGIRMIGDVDILVPKSDAQRAVSVLEDLEWSPKGDPPRVSADYVSVSKGLSLIHPGGGALDLHWHLFPEDYVTAHEEPVWRHAIPAPMAGVSTLAPSPTEMLLHVCVHGWAWCPHPPFRWVADAMTILRASQAELDWERLIEGARRRRLVPRLAAALIYLQTRFGAEVPSHALTDLRNTSIPRLDRWEYRLRTRPVRTPAGGLVLHLSRFNRLRGASDLGLGFIGFLDYFRRQWGLEHVRQVPLRMGAKLVHRLARYLRRKAV